MGLQESKCAYCILTYNHPDRIEIVLNAIVPYYKKYGIDIYVYDSSEDNQTEQVVSDIVKRGGDNVYLVKLKSDVLFDEKSLLMFSGYGQRKKYDYIWPAKDRTAFYEECIVNVSKNMTEGYDVIFLTSYEHFRKNIQDKERETEYTDCTEFFSDWGWMATSLDATIFKYDSLLSDFNKEQFKEKYYFGEIHGYIHYVLLFDGLARIADARVKVLQERFGQVPGAASTWFEDVFEIWAERWMKVTDSLSVHYNEYKAKVTKDAASLPWILGSCDQLIYYKEIHALTPKVVERLKNKWHLLSDVSLEELELITQGKNEELCVLVINRMIGLMADGEYEEARRLRERNTKALAMYLVGAIGKEYMLLQCCFDIHNIEMENNIIHGIFKGISNYKEAIERYKQMKFWLRRLEYDIAPETWNELIPFIKKNHISKSCISYMIGRVCLDRTKILERLVSLFIINNEIWEREYE